VVGENDYIEARKPLTIRIDGTVLQGNYRIKVLEERDFDTEKIYKYADIEIKIYKEAWE